MNDLEKYIKKNKEAFDTYEPSEALWSRLEKKLDASDSPQKAKTISLKYGWIAAAAVVLFVVAGVLFFPERKSGVPNPSEIAVQDSPKINNRNDVAIIKDTPQNFPIAQSNGIYPAPQEKIAKNPAQVKGDQSLSTEMYHYSRLIELKQKQIAVIKEQSPELYNRFLKDLESLEYGYDALREKQKGGINNEQLLEAMILNLKMQASLLNKQLEVTKHIKNKKEDEKPNGL